MAGPDLEISPSIYPCRSCHYWYVCPMALDRRKCNIANAVLLRDSKSANTNDAGDKQHKTTFQRQIEYWIPNTAKTGLTSKRQRIAIYSCSKIVEPCPPEILLAGLHYLCYLIVTADIRELCEPFLPSSWPHGRWYEGLQSELPISPVPGSPLFYACSTHILMSLCWQQTPAEQAHCDWTQIHAAQVFSF